MLLNQHLIVGTVFNSSCFVIPHATYFTLLVGFDCMRRWY